MEPSEGVPWEPHGCKFTHPHSQCEKWRNFINGIKLKVKKHIKIPRHTWLGMMILFSVELCMWTVNRLTQCCTSDPPCPATWGETLMAVKGRRRLVSGGVELNSSSHAHPRLWSTHTRTVMWHLKVAYSLYTLPIISINHNPLTLPARVSAWGEPLGVDGMGGI